MTKVHAIQNAEYRIYESIDSKHCIGHFLPKRKYPISFFGNSPEEVTQRIKDFIAETVEKHGVDEAIAKQAKVKKDANKKVEDDDDDFEDLLS